VKAIHTSPSSAAPETPTPTTLLDRLNQLPDDAKWALDHIITMDDGATIATALQNNTALAVSDGSLKLGFGTAAYILEGVDSTNRILGVNKVPGPIKDGDSHRCKVAGIYAVALLVMAICKHYNIHKGTITMACDNTQALQLFDPEYLPDPSHKNFDIINATWHLLQQTNITWIGDHVKGHQDKHKYQRLTRKERLNIEMDALAKHFWRARCVHTEGWIPKPQHIPIYGEGWQIWHGNNKIAHPNRHKLYKTIQDPITKNW
jgi:hypothetical protein